MGRRLDFVLGGTRSGKSGWGLHLAKQSGGRVLYVATADANDGDREMERRIAGHRRARPAEWDTLEAREGLPAEIAAVRGYDTVLLDGLTLWVSRLAVAREQVPDMEASVLTDVNALLDVYAHADAAWVVVSDEVGLGVVPPTPLGRVFRDVLGRVHQIVAAQADEFWLASAGYVLPMKALGARRVPRPLIDR